MNVEMTPIERVENEKDKVEKDAKETISMIMKSLVILLFCLTCTAFSAENPARKRVGRITLIQTEDIDSIKKQLIGLSFDGSADFVNSYGVNSSVFMKDLAKDKYVIFFYSEQSEENQDFPGEKSGVSRTPSAKNLQWENMEEVFYFGGASGVTVDDSQIERYGMVIGLRPEMVESYKLLHKHAWPEVLAKITEGNIRNYSIFLHELNGNFYLFSYFEYIGLDFDVDMNMIDSDPATIAWMKYTDSASQIPLTTRSESEWWAVMERIFSGR